MSARRLLPILAAAVGGFLLARLVTVAPAPAPSPEPSRLAVAAPARCPSLDAAFVRAEIRAALRDELPTLAPPSEAEPAEPRTAPAPPTTQALASDAAGLGVIDRARQSGHWRVEDADELRRLLPAMSDDGRRDTMSALSLAINEQRLVVEALPPI